MAAGDKGRGTKPKGGRMEQGEGDDQSEGEGVSHNQSRNQS